MEFLQAIRAVAAGGIYLDPAMNSHVAGGLLTRHGDAPSQARATISERESEVLRQIAVGHSNKEVAAHWGSVSRPSKSTKRMPCGSSD